jgi:DNA repair protein RadC
MGAVSLILCHNHPSGEVIPSTDDLSLTMAVKEAGELIGISIRDHIILGNNQYYSFNDKGLL